MCESPVSLLSVCGTHSARPFLASPAGSMFLMSAELFLAHDPLTSFLPHFITAQNQSLSPRGNE